MANRDHRKINLVDDRVAYLGGVNLSDNVLGRIDFMLKISNPMIVKALAREFQMPRPKKSKLIVCDEQNSLIVDAGDRRRSLTFEKIIEMVSNSQKEIIIASQLPPNRLLTKKINAALHRGVSVRMLTNSNSLETIYKTYSMQSNGLTEFEGDNPEERKVHAKLIIVDGQEAILGSHNITHEIGNFLRATELNLYTRDLKTINALTHHFDEIMLKDRENFSY